jgi:hypothetical protein
MKVGWQSEARLTLGVGTVTGIVPIIFENPKVVTTVRITLCITESLPFIAAVVATALAQDKAIVDFSISEVESSMTVLPVVTKRLRKFITNFISDNVFWPHRLVLPPNPLNKVTMTLGPAFFICI